MKITVIGAGYVGLVVAVCLAVNGHNIVCLESSIDKCKKLSAGQCPILEKELPQMLRQAINKNRICFTTQAKEAIPHAEIIFITVGTPTNENGEANLEALFTAIQDIKKYGQNGQTVVIKSSIPPGTTATVRNELITSSHNSKDIGISNVVYNPEFLREGTAVNDFLSPDRIIVGSDNRLAADILFSLYRPILRNTPVEIFTSSLNAELVKYASNSYLAVRLSFINELAGLCEMIGGNISEVSAAMGLDHRIGREYLTAGLGYGGACLPKDTRALAYIAQKVHSPLSVLESAISANNAITQRLAERVIKYVPKGGKVAVWGLTFKAGTDDIRKSPVFSLIKNISLHVDCSFRIFDPTCEYFSNNYPRELLPLICHTVEETLEGSDVLIISTAWPQFRDLNLDILLPRMKGKTVFDFLCAIDKNEVQKKGFKYFTCGES